MTRDAHTLELFPAAPSQRRSGCHMDARLAHAFSDGVRREVLAVFRNKPMQWLDWRDFRPLMDKHQISFCFGHILFRLVSQGEILEKRIYFGTEAIGPNYLGFGGKWASLGTPGPYVEARIAATKAAGDLLRAGA